MTFWWWWWWCASELAESGWGKVPVVEASPKRYGSFELQEASGVWVGVAWRGRETFL